MLEITHRKKRLSSFKLIVLGFAGVIVLGALILLLPFSSTAGVVTPFHEALFTSTSAVCVTGLPLGVLSQLILIVLMYLGRVGGLTLIYAAISNKNQSCAKLPLEKITVG